MYNNKYRDLVFLEFRDLAILDLLDLVFREFRDLDLLDLDLLDFAKSTKTKFSGTLFAKCNKTKLI